MGPSLAESRRPGGTPKKSAIPNPHRGGAKIVLKITNLGNFFLWKAVSWLSNVAKLCQKSMLCYGSRRMARSGPVLAGWNLGGKIIPGSPNRREVRKWSPQKGNFLDEKS